MQKYDILIYFCFIYCSKSDGNGNSMEIKGTMQYVQQFTDMTRYVKS